jgi:hypothetical protein
MISGIRDEIQGIQVLKRVSKENERKGEWK